MLVEGQVGAQLRRNTEPLHGERFLHSFLRAARHDSTRGTPWALRFPVNKVKRGRQLHQPACKQRLAPASPVKSPTRHNPGFMTLTFCHLSVEHELAFGGDTLGLCSRLSGIHNTLVCCALIFPP